MALSFVENGDSRAYLGPSVAIQDNTATPAAADYPTGGYPINPQNWGFGVIRGLTVIAKTGTALNYLWDFVPAAASSITNTYAGNLYVQSALGVQAAANTDLSGGTVTIHAIGF